MRYDRMVILDEDKRKEWDEMDSQFKKTVLHNLQRFTDEMEVTISIQLLSNVIVDLNNRICELEKKVFQEGNNGSNNSQER